MPSGEKPDDDAPRSSPRPARDALGDSRPPFLLGYPRHPDLQRVAQAFELGDFAEVRRLAPRLVQSAREPDVRRAAEELLERTRPDPLLLWLLGLALALFAFVASWTYAG